MMRFNFSKTLTLRPRLAILLLSVPLLCQAQTLRPSSSLNTAPAKASMLATTAPGLQQSVDFIVAVVNSEPVTNNELLSRLARIEQQLQQRGAPAPARQELLRELLEQIISERAQLQLARELGLRVEDNALEQAMQNVARQNQVSAEELRRRLVAQADEKAYVQFRSNIRDELLIGRVREREVDSRVKVTEQEISQFLAEKANSSSLADLDINLAQILVVVPEKASPAQVAQLQTRAQLALNRARFGDNFAALVQEFSTAPGRSADGQMGLRTADRYPPLFAQATQNVPVGGLSDLIRSDAGFHILKVLEKKPTDIPGALLVQTHARHILLRPDAKLTEAAAKTRLQDFKKRVLAKQTDFATLARDNGQDGSAAEGGDLGWANPGMFVPEFEEQMNRLLPGQIADPFASRFGVHLVQVLERRPVKLAPNEQRELVRNLIREKKIAAEYTTWAREVRGRAYVEYRELPK